MDYSTPGFILHYLSEFAQIHVHWVGDAIQPSHPLLPLVLLPSVFPSIRVFSSESGLCIRWPEQTEWLKQQTFLSRSHGSLKVQDQGASWFSSWWEPPSWSANGWCLTISLHVRERARALYLFLFSSVTQLCPTLCIPMDCSTPGCPSPTPGAYSNSCPLSQWCHPTISSSVILFSSHLQSFPTSGSFPMSQLFTSGGQSIGVSTSASVLPMNIQDWFPLGWTSWISLQSQGTLKSLLQQCSSKASILWHSAFFIVQLSHPYTTTRKTIALTKQTFVGKVMSLLFNMLSRLVIAFLPRSKCLLISWLQSPSAVIMESKNLFLLDKHWSHYDFM